jgi:hypothetical protein
MNPMILVCLIALAAIAILVMFRLRGRRAKREGSRG